MVKNKNTSDGTNQALIIGINKYENKDLETLEIPAINAERIKNRLIGQGTFHKVNIPENGTRKELKESIINLFKPNGPNCQMALLYFSGYMLVRDEKGFKEFFLTTSDSNPAEDYELGISLIWLKHILQESPVEQQIVILDCCYNEEQKRDIYIDINIPGYQYGKDRLFLISFHKNNHYFLKREEDENSTTYLTKAILCELNLYNSYECIDNKELIKKLKKSYEIKLKEYGDYKRIYFGKKINILKTQAFEKSADNKDKLEKKPYKGLDYFDYEKNELNGDDAEYFYGRQRLTDELIEKVRKNNFLAVMGATGSGKSSVIRAGLVYHLQLGEQISGSENWLISVFEPGNCPLQSLAEALAKEILKDELKNNNKDIQNEIAKAKEYIKEGSVNDLQKLINLAQSERVVIVIDQFEEVFTLCEDDEKIEEFFKCILGALNNTKNLCLVIALRVDFFGKCSERKYEGLSEKIQQHLVAVTPMDDEELKEAIENPARDLGVSVDNELIQQLIEDVEKEPGSLPLLQYTLQQLWEKLPTESNTITSDLYDETLKKLKGLDKYADSVYKKLTDKEKEIAKYIFLKLTHLGDGTEDTRKKTLARELTNTLPYKENIINSVTKKLIKEKLIIREIEKEGEFVNLVHDVLIRHWSQLNQWLEEYRSYSKQKKSIEEKAKKREVGESNTNYFSSKDLEEIEIYIENYGYILPLSEQANQFIEESKKKQRIENRNIFIGLLLLFSIILFFIASFGYVKAEEIRNNKQFLSNQSAALTSYSNTLFNDNEKFDGLIEALRAAIPLKKQGIPLPENIKPVLKQAVDGVKERNRLERHKGSIYNVSFSPDGQILASGSLDETIRIWNVRTGKEIQKLTGHQGKVYKVTFNPQNNSQLASSSADGTIRIWNLQTGEYKQFTGHKGKVYSLSFSNDGKILASSSLDKSIKLWNVDTDEEILELTGHQGKVYSISFNPQDSTQLVSGSADGTVRLWNIETGESKILSKRNYNIYTVRFSPDGQKLASGSTDGTVHIWNFATGKEFYTLNKHKYSVHSVIFSPDSQTLASGSFDNTIKLWDVATGKEITTITGHKDWVNSISFNPKDNKILASGCADGTIKLWDIDKVQSLTTLTGHENWVNSIIFNPQNDTQLASASVDGTIKLWNINTGEKKNISTEHKRVNSVSFSPDGKILASSNADGSIKLWDTQTLQEIKPSLPGHNNWVNSVSFNPQDGTKLASGSNDEKIKVWDIKTGENIFEKKGRSEFNAVRFSFDGKLLAAASFDNTIKLWDAETGKEKRTLEGHKNKVSSISFSHDGKYLVSGSFDNTVKIWNLETGEVLTLKGHTGKVESVSFSPNGRIVASGSADKTIKLWDVKTGREIKTFAGHANDVLTVSFNSSGTILASGSADEKIILWRIPGEKEINESKNKDLNRLIKEGCDWTRDYLQNNPNVPDNDKHLCENIN